jgi:MoaA/NifB/PqqE/SkfB family radical SAM enzyme
MVTSKKTSYLESAVRLFFNGLKFRFFKLIRSPLKPTVISLAITNRCNSHCIMCNIWKREGELSDIKSMELSKKQIIYLLSSPLFSELVELDITGGEPHLRDDLVEIILEISKLKKNYLPRLKSIIIASNGLLPQKIISNYQDILEGLNDTGIDLISVSSLDGIGETHDKIRGTKGAFKLVSETINGLLELKLKYPHFYIGIKTTVTRYNITSLNELLDYAIEKNIFHIISPVLFTEGRFRNIDKRDKLMLKPRDYQEVLTFYRGANLSTSFFYSTLKDYLADGRKRWGCTALYAYIFIDFDGKVYPCEMISEPIGDVKKQAIEDIWNGSSAHEWRIKFKRMDYCATCNEPGAIRYSASIEGFSYLKFLLKLGRNKYNEAFYQEGFSKYFNL